MGIKRWLSILTLAALVGIPSTTFACGESLFRVGKGVTYREYNAPIPGNIVVIARTDAELAMMERLEAAGHQITVISDAADLDSVLGDASVDIVMSWFSERSAVLSELQGHDASYLPVTTADEVKLARTEHRHSVSGDGDVKDFLKAIHKSLKKRA